MPSLWTDNDTGGHPWLAAPAPRPGAASPPPLPPAHAEPDGTPTAWQRLARPAVVAAACIAAVLAGAEIELLR
jgi:hypothetical protein